jgi:4-carboxymuconolactone decarboxylase
MEEKGHREGETFEHLAEEMAKDLMGQVDSYDLGVKKYLTEDLTGKIYARPQLDLKTHELCTISTLVTLGVASELILTTHFGIALSVATQEEIRELIVQLHPIAGWPVVLSSFEVFNRVLEEKKVERKLQPLREKYEEVNWYKEGMDTGRKIHGLEEWGRLADKVQKFETGAADFLIEDVYGEVFNRNSILDIKTRHLCFVAALTVLNNMPILKTFILGALNVGCTPQEVKEVIFQMSCYRGWPVTINAIDAFNEVMESRR